MIRHFGRILNLVPVLTDCRFRKNILARNRFATFGLILLACGEGMDGIAKTGAVVSMEVDERVMEFAVRAGTGAGAGFRNCVKWGLQSTFGKVSQRHLLKDRQRGTTSQFPDQWGQMKCNNIRRGKNVL